MSSRNSYSYSVKSLQKEIGWSDSKVEWLIFSGQLHVKEDGSRNYYMTPEQAYYYLELPRSYRIEQFQDTRDYGLLLKARGL